MANQNDKHLTIPRPQWPDGKRFAFTVYDETDSASLENVRGVYALLTDLGFRTTKTIWPLRGNLSLGVRAGQTCEDDAYRDWLLGLQAKGFEIAWHGATWHSSTREQTIQGMDKFAAIFGRDPVCAANHTRQAESMYWADKRLTGINVLIYNLLTRLRNQGQHCGEVPGDRYFWGDVCHQRIKYFRNFVFRNINTLKACPLMPYHDPRRPLVQNWFAASDGADWRRFNACISERQQDQLEEEGGACIMYTHFAFGFTQQGRVEPRFHQLMERLARKGGWFVPVASLLDHLMAARGPCVISDSQRSRLERKWLLEKITVGTT